MHWLHPYSFAWNARPLIFLDLDDTLVKTTPGTCGGDAFTVFSSYGYHVHVRPHACQLLRYMVQRVKRGEANLGFWSTGTHTYVCEVIHTLFSLAGVPDYQTYVHMVATREATPSVNGTFVKTMELLLEPNTLLIDDSVIHASHPGNEGRVLLVTPFTLDPADTVLTHLMYLLDAKYAWPPLYDV